jgi:hypothetical protein
VWSVQDGFGPAGLCDGVRALEWLGKTRAPARFLQLSRSYQGNYIDAQLQVNSVIRDTPPYTFAVALDDTAAPETMGEVSLSCWYEVPEGVQSEIFGTITSVTCGTIGSGDCYFYISSNHVNNFTCPAPTPTETPGP